MIHTTTVSGRPAQVAYIGAGQNPVSPDDAVLIKVLFTDETGGMVFLVGPKGEPAPVKSLQTKDSAHTDWMNECVPELMAYGKDQTVAIAACLNMWRDAWEESHPDGADDPGPSRPDEKQLIIAREHLRDAALAAAAEKPERRSLRQRFRLARAQARELLARGTWNEADHPRDPGGEGGGQFISGGGGGAGGEKPKPGKSKKPAKKEDFDKAKITFRKAGGAHTAQSDEEFVAKWNEKVGIEPEEFKKTFLGGVDASMTIVDYGTKYDISGSIWGEGADKGAEVGTYNREIKIDAKEAYSAYFKLNKSTTKHNIGKKVLGGNVEMYEALGIEKVGVTANIDVGGYAWAKKYGYVPTQDAWNSLRGKLENKLTGSSSSSSGNRGDNTVEADDWEQLSSSTQDDVRDRWMRDSRDEFISSEEQNWRDSGGAKNDAKYELAQNFRQDDSIPEWAVEALDGAREYREEHEQPPIPFTNKQLFDAMDLTYTGDNGDGEDDPKIEFNDNRLQEPSNYDPGQGTLPGIEPLDPASYLTKDMRERITKRMVASFDKKAEDNADDIEAPSHLADSVDEYMDEYWDQKSDREKLQHAIDYDMHHIEVEPDEDDEEPQQEMDLPKSESDPLLAAARSSDPKSIWKIADSSRGKELLLGSGWNGVLNLKDPESMKRFKDYVGRAAHG